MSASERILENIASQQRSEQSQCKHSSSKSTHDCPAATIQSELDHVRGMAPNSDAALGNYKREAALYASIEGDMKKGGDAARLQVRRMTIAYTCTLAHTVQSSLHMTRRAIKCARRVVQGSIKREGGSGRVVTMDWVTIGRRFLETRTIRSMESF